MVRIKIEYPGHCTHGRVVEAEIFTAENWLNIEMYKYTYKGTAYAVPTTHARVLE